jgi:hypothetical protein
MFQSQPQYCHGVFTPYVIPVPHADAEPLFLHGWLWVSFPDGLLFLSFTQQTASGLSGGDILNVCVNAIHAGRHRGH